jgi:hypothetical protein
MTTTANNNFRLPTAEEVIAKNEKILEVCNKEIEYLTNPKKYGCCLSRCNRIVINKDRMMTVTTDDKGMTDYEFRPLYPTYFSREAANEIVKNDIYRDINGNRIKMEIIGKLEYYQMLKENAESVIKLFKSIEH